MDYLRSETIINNIKLYQNLPDKLFFYNAMNTINSLKERSDLVDLNLDTVYTIMVETIRRKTGKTLRPTQVEGALKLYQGDIIGMKTGEGKTYTALLPAAANALKGKVHIATTNSYLAGRDFSDNKDIFESIGLSCGLVSEEDKDIKAKQAAYSKDIVYSTSSALAFDYLLDTTELSKDTIRNKEERRNYLIIDEADNMLIDEATNPYVISSPNRTDEVLYSGESNLRFSAKAFETEKMRAMIAGAAVHEMYEAYQKNPRLMRVFDDSYDYDSVIKSHKLNDMFTERYLLLKDNKTSRITLTEKGYRYLSYSFLKDDADKVLNESGLKNLDSNDYYIENNKLHFTINGYVKALEKETYKALNKMYDSEEFANRFNEVSKEINNAITAYFSLQKGKDYLVEPSSQNKMQSELKLIIGGRISEGRNYSNGLQMAAEIKEANLSPGLDMVLNNDGHKAASITAASFLSLYDNISGMTGTPPAKAIKYLYDKDVSFIDSFNEYQAAKGMADEVLRKDNPDYFYFDDEERLDALVSDAIRASKEGRPILISTRSVEESNLVTKRLSERGVFANCLNAQTKMEATIIKNAGKRGKVTVATEMAGRGTDIKLGGDIDDIINDLDNLVEKRFLDQYIKRNNLDPAKDLSLLKEAVLNFRNNVSPEIKETYKKEIVRDYYLEKEQIKEMGGLLILGSGHFDLERIDKQVRGRSGRSGDPGETRFYTSLDDLYKQGVALNDNDIEKFKKLAKKDKQNHLFIEGSVPEELFKEVQERKEALRVDSIKTGQEEEYIKEIVRKKHVKDRSEFLHVDNLHRLFNITLNKATDYLVDEAIDHDNKELLGSKKLKDIPIDLMQVKDTIRDNLGVDIRMPKVSTLNTFKMNLQHQVKDALRDLEINENDRLLMLEGCDYAYDIYEERSKENEFNMTFIKDKEEDKNEKALKAIRFYDESSKEMMLNAASMIINKKPSLYLEEKGTVTMMKL